MARKNAFFKSRKFKYGSVATGLTVAFIAVVIIINVIFSLLTDAFSWKLDVTSYDLYSISDTTKQIVNALAKDQKIELTVVYSEDNYPEDSREIIKRFANLSENISVKYVDPDVNPQIITAFGTEYSITEGAIVVQNGNRTRVIAFEDTYEQDTSTYAVTYKIEECLASAVMYVTKEEVPLVYFVTGHGESGYEAMMNMIANNGADVKEVNLSQLSSFDDQARVMFLSGPIYDYNESEIRLLQEFLTNDYHYERDLFFFANNKAPKLPNLEAFLAEWGITLQRNVVLESENYSASSLAQYFTGSSAGAPLYGIPTYTGNEVSATTITADLNCVVPNSCALTIANVGITEVVSILQSSEESYAKSTDVVNVNYNKSSEDEEGPFTLAAVATRYKYEDNVAVESHLFAAGSLDMANEFFVTNNGNGEFLFNVYRMMVGENELEIVGAAKKAGSVLMVLDDTTVDVATAVFAVAIPLVFLVIGLVVFIRRRYL